MAMAPVEAAPWGSPRVGLTEPSTV